MFLLSFIITVLREKNYLYKINFILVRGFICIIYFHLICFYIVKKISSAFLDEYFIKLICFITLEPILALAIVLLLTSKDIKMIGEISRRTTRHRYSSMIHMPARSYIAIDLKSFYASVECMERGLDR